MNDELKLTQTVEEKFPGSDVVFYGWSVLTGSLREQGGGGAQLVKVAEVTQ